MRRNDATVLNTTQIHSLQTFGDGEIQALSDVLIDCVEGGASVGFMQPLSRAKANAFWREAAAGVARGERLLLAAADAAGAILGTVQIVFAPFENQPHRADIAKMLVLDTASSDAERLYAKLGWQPCGVIPGFALLPGGGLCDTKFFYRTLKEPV